MKLRNLLYALLIGTIGLVYACSSDTEQTQKQTVDTSVYAKEVVDPIADNLKPGDTLSEEAVSFKLNEIVKGKLEADSTFVNVVYEHETYGRAHIVCRSLPRQDFNELGASWNVASGCLFSNGHLYNYTWWSDHYETTASGAIIFIRAGSRYELNDKCKC